MVKRLEKPSFVMENQGFELVIGEQSAMIGRQFVVVGRIGVDFTLNEPMVIPKILGLGKRSRPNQVQLPCETNIQLLRK